MIADPFIHLLLNTCCVSDGAKRYRAWLLIPRTSQPSGVIGKLDAFVLAGPMSEFRGAAPSGNWKGVPRPTKRARELHRETRVKKTWEELQCVRGRRESWREMDFEDVMDGDHLVTKDGKREKWIEL